MSPAGAGPNRRNWSTLIGSRIVVRVQSPNGLYDVLGDLLEADGTVLRIDTRRGVRDVVQALVIAGGPVPPAPTRAAPPHRALSVGDLEVVMADHWRPSEQDWLGGWLLRAHHGFTRRANSVLAVGDPGMPLDVAVLEVSDWYADRGLPPLAATPYPRLDEDDAEQLLGAAAAFEREGWRPIDGAGAVVLTAPTGELRAHRPPPEGLGLQLQPRPDDGWLARYHYRGQPMTPDGARLLTSAPDQVFVSVLDGVETVGVARGSIARSWCGLTAVEVHPHYRRRGVATALLSAIAGWAWQRGALSTYVQVGEANDEGLTLYRNSGFEDHHTYAYLTPSA